MRMNPYRRSSAAVGPLLLAAMVFEAGCTTSVDAPGAGPGVPLGGGPGGGMGAGASAGSASAGAGSMGAGQAAAAGSSGANGSAGATPVTEPAAQRPEPGAEFACDAAAAAPGPTQVRRLTLQEYVNTVEHALGIKIAPLAAAALPPEVASSGFDNDANALVAGFDHIAGYERMANTIADQVGDRAAFVARFSDCSTLTEACQTKFIDTLGARLFRAPVEAGERSALLALYQAAVAEAATFVEASTLVFRAMLQAPRFLYRVENERGDGSIRPASDMELASRLSYALWQSPPDDALYAAAQAGKLRDDAGLATETQRMLQDPRAYAAAQSFFGDWIDLRRLDTLQRSPEMFPNFDNALHADMQQETTALFQRVWQNQLPLTSIYDAETTTVSEKLARHYGFPSPKPGVTSYDVSANTARAGLLTHGSILAIGGERASTVIRGLFLMENVLCAHIVAPPATVDTTPPELRAGASRRSVSEGRVNNAACGGCHAPMEQPVWGLVRYDATGAYSERDEFGNSLPSDGQIGFPGEAAPQRYSDARELSRILAGHERPRDCLTLKIAQYALGRAPTRSEACALNTARQAIASSAGSYGDIIRALSHTDLFRRIKTQAQ